MSSLLQQMRAAKMKGEAKRSKKGKPRKTKEPPNESWSITICESGENHTGMEILGKKASEGMSCELLKEAKIKAEADKYECTYFDLKELGLSEEKERYDRADEAGVLIIRDVLGKFGATKEGLRKEMKNIDCDKKYYDVRRSKVLNKNARHNVCFDYRDQEPDIANKKGRVVNINSLENLKSVIGNLHLYFGDKAKGLIAELNHYYDVKKCGIGFHGDTERRIVICVRLGESFPLHYYWYENSKRVGKRITLPHLNEGDVYIMSDKAVGYDWKLRKNNRLTLRHSAGCDKFTK
jgi:hypothetical protein